MNLTIKDLVELATEQADRLAEHIAAAGVTHYGETGDTIRDHMRKHPAEQTVGGVVSMLVLELDAAVKRAEAAENALREIAAMEWQAAATNYFGYTANKIATDALAPLDAAKEVA